MCVIVNMHANNEGRVDLYKYGLNKYQTIQSSYALCNFGALIQNVLSLFSMLADESPQDSTSFFSERLSRVEKLSEGISNSPLLSPCSLFSRRGPTDEAHKNYRFCMKIKFLDLLKLELMTINLI